MKYPKMSLIGEKLFQLLCLVCIFLPLFLLALLIADVFRDGLDRISWDFFTSFPSRNAKLAGILPALAGSIYLGILTAAIALPIGVSAALYLEEYDKKSKLSQLIEVNIANLAGVPSVIYGLLGLEIFVRIMGWGNSILAGACTLALLVLPVIIMSSREALRTVPHRMREVCYGLGATKWQMIWHVVLPMAFPGILTGAILSMSRTIGETAPLIVIGAATYMAYVPDSILSDFTALPIQIFNWVSRPQKGFLINAAAGIIVLLVTLMCLNAIAIVLRNRMQRR